MIAALKLPHYLLFTDATDGRDTFDDLPAGQWCFRLESLSDEDDVIEALDAEPEGSLERLELLAVVRGLEALDQPSRVTLISASRYVARGLRFGMDTWRESNWQWESYGVMQPVKNHDLWQRIDRAMEFHQVEHRRWRLDRSEQPAVQTGDAETAGKSGAETIVQTLPDMAAVAV